MGKEEAARLLAQASEYAADEEWAEEAFSTLHTIAKIEILESQSISVVKPEMWAGFSQLVVDKNVRNGAEHHSQQLEDSLALVPYVEVHGEKTWDISLNYTNGASQYLSCIKFAAKKNEDGNIVIAQTLFGRKWVEQKDYHLNRSFWEVSPAPQRLKNYLEAGANKIMHKALEGPEGRSALEQCC